MAMDLEAYREARQEQEREGFVVDDAQKANWALRKIKQLEAKKKENTTLADEEVAVIRDWEREENGKLQQDIDFFTSLLERYHRDLYAQDPDIKTIKMPNGQMKMRVQQPEFRRDDKVLLDWIKNEWVPAVQAQYVRTTEKPDWRELKGYLEVAGDRMVDPESGQVVEGIEVVEREPKFSVEV